MTQIPVAKRHSLFRLPPRPSAGFSLIEVTIALGLSSFVLVALLGLASAGLNASKRSAEDTALVQIAEHAFSVGLTPLAAGASASHSFTREGMATTNSSDAYYSAVLSAESPAAPEDDNGHLFLLKLEVSWPGGTNIFHGSAVAR